MKRTPLKKVNPKRKAKLFAEQYGGDYADLIRAMDCIVATSNCEGPMQATHVKSKGAGGKAKDLVPLCFFHHSLQHNMGILSFQNLYAIDLAAEAKRLWDASKEEQS